MVLSRTTLLPHSMLPLRIFEEHYRQMLHYALQHDRLFAVALSKPDPQPSGSESFHRVAGLGMIRACVKNEDGTSHLVLQGVARVELTRVLQDSPFLIAEIREIPSTVSNELEAEALGSRLFELYEKMKRDGVEFPAALEKHLPHLADPDVLSNIVTHAFVQDPLRQQAILAERDVSNRMRLLIEFLKTGG